jgi:uncharacterized membrane protein YccC
MMVAAGAAAAAAVFTFAAHGRWPYHYYGVFRWFIFIACAIAAYILRSRPGALIASVGVAVAFNPIAPLRMRAVEWRNYDVAGAVVMTAVAMYAWRLENSLRRAEKDSDTE